MRSRKLKATIVLLMVVGSLVISLAIRGRAQKTLHQQGILLRQQARQTVELEAESQHLLALVTQTNQPTAMEVEMELHKLRDKAETLGQKVDELRKKAAEKPQVESRKHFPSLGVGHVVSDSDSEEYHSRLYSIGRSDPHVEPAANIDALKDAQNLGCAAYLYAREHDGRVPATFDEASEFFMKTYRPPRSSAYELVYQGSLNELTNIPATAVAMVREREAWPTPDGKWARIYVMTGQYVEIVESDDNFQAWEAQHVVPPPSN